MIDFVSRVWRRVLALLILVCLICAVFGTMSPAYLTLGNFQGMLRATAISGIVAVGLTFVIVVRKFDLSLAGIASLSAMTLGFAMQETNTLWIIVVSALVAGLLCGLVNGFLIGRFGLPDVITTIAVGSIAYGLGFIYNGGGDFSKNFFSSGLVKVNFEKVLGLQLPVLLLIVTAVLAAILLHGTRFGHAFYATGENPVTARFSGISVPRVFLAAFGICGTLVGLGMLLQVAGVGSSRVTTGAQIMLPAYTAVYLGAALLGRPSIAATLIGATVMTLLLN